MPDIVGRVPRIALFLVDQGGTHGVPPAVPAGGMLRGAVSAHGFRREPLVADEGFVGSAHRRQSRGRSAALRADPRVVMGT